MREPSILSKAVSLAVTSITAAVMLRAGIVAAKPTLKSTTTKTTEL